jgi:type I restriction enzyme, S subunit
MEVKPGYHQTEIGLLPNDWKTMSLLRVVVDGGLVRGPFGGTLKKEFFVRQGYKVYEQRNAIYGTIDKGNYWIDDAKFKELARFSVQPGNLIVSCSGTIGCIFKIPDGSPEGVINQALLKIVLDEKKVNVDLFLAIFRSPPFQDRITDNSHGGAMQNLVGMDVFKKTQFQLPPLSEQEPIAEALSDADALIESLEQLIAKKRQIKQGAMQELLTGNKRLPGFSGKWEETDFGSIAKRIVGGGTPSRDVESYWNGKIPWMTVKDFANHNPKGTIEYISDDGLKMSASHLIPAHILITSTRMALGKAVLFEVDVAINQDLKAIFPTKDVDTLFLFYWFQFNEIRISEMGSGSTVMGISLGDLRKIPFSKPRISEQTAIATILSDMHRGIAALEDKLTKAREIKQGMMQELLTGRIRLI